MRLADLRLQEMPIEALECIRDAVLAELRQRGIHNTRARKKLRTYISTASYSVEEFISIYEEYTREKSFPISNEPAALPSHALLREWRERLRYFPAMYLQDWTYLFPKADMVEQKFYVYAHIDPRGKPTNLGETLGILPGKPFYIGKGTGGRAWDLRRNEGHGKRIRHIRRLGYAASSIVQILQDSLTEQQALALEAKMIYFFGSVYSESINGCLVNLDDHVCPEFDQVMQGGDIESRQKVQSFYEDYLQNRSKKNLQFFPRKIYASAAWLFQWHEQKQRGTSLVPAMTRALIPYVPPGILS